MISLHSDDAAPWWLPIIPTQMQCLVLAFRTLPGLVPEHPSKFIPKISLPCNTYRHTNILSVPGKPKLVPTSGLLQLGPFCAVFFPYPRPSPSAHSDFSLISPPQRDPSSPTKSHRPFTLLYFLPECSLLSEMLPFTSRSFLLERKSQALMDRFFVHLLFPALGMESGTK